MRIRILIVDDEPLARERLIALLQDEADIAIAGECPDGRSAIDFIAHHSIDLVLLDIQMPELNGFDMVKQLAPERMPAIVFVTVYDSYALDAFEVHALDYLLKPVEKERLTAALNQVRQSRDLQRLGMDMHQRVADMLRDLELRRSSPDRILLKADGEITFFDPEEIDWIEAAGNYVTLHLTGRSKFLRETLSALEKKLKPYGFARLSRSVLVNTSRIKSMRSAQYGDYSIQLRDATELMLNRGYREAFFQFVDRPIAT